MILKDGLQLSLLSMKTHYYQHYSTMNVNGPVSSILSSDFNYTVSEGNLYVGDTQWHSDSSETGKYRSLKAAFYLDQVDFESGCLRVLPGSIHYGNIYTDNLNEVIPTTAYDKTKEIWGVG